MISLPLFKRNMISSIKLLLVFIAILAMYTSVIIYMFDPTLADTLNQYQEMMPGIMSAVGMSGSSGTLIEFLNTYLYGFLMLMIPTIFEIILINKLVMKYIDSGSMACLLSTPNSRKKIIITQILSILISIIILIVVITGIGLICSQSMFPNDLDVEKYIQLNISTMLLAFAMSGIAFVTACFSNESKWYLTFGAGLPVLFYLIKMLANMGGDLEKLKYFTIITLLPGDKIVEGASGVLSCNLILLGIAVILYVCGAIGFIKRDLPL
ncbi:ABC transporter permease [Romboutsia weinsteinii]|uniref:ABC transporter permease n=1 Tax=Romboutsia weinsteinii TaxID=2020949 RepID=A0A371J620_9FIRM|nr:ABC transporter permease subunit [Romboutsia weinsteinii]RDY28106.1 ABC transporter permease [Romboutsia weinsteinii]